jgi:hypothetical protein
MDSIGGKIDPMPTAPAVFRKSRREKFPCFSDILEASLIDKRGLKIKNMGFHVKNFSGWPVESYSHPKPTKKTDNF